MNMSGTILKEADILWKALATGALLLLVYDFLRVLRRLIPHGTAGIAAEDILQDMGVLSIMSSDSMAMGRIGEVVTRTWQNASKMKVQRGKLPEDCEENDNY